MEEPRNSCAPNRNSTIEDARPGLNLRWELTTPALPRTDKDTLPHRPVRPQRLVGDRLDKDGRVITQKNPFWYIPKKVLSLSHGSINVGIDQQFKLREQLIQARKSVDLTQVELAVRLGRPQSFVSKYERGERRLDIIEFCEVCRALGKDPVRFLQRFYSEES